MNKSIQATKRVLPKLKKPTFDDFKGFNEKFSIIHDFFVRVVVILAFSTFIIFLLKEMTSNKYVLTNIEVAHSIEENDKIYHGDLKQKIIIDMKSIVGNAKNATHSASNIANAISNDAIPVNIGGFDLNQIFLYLRNFLQMQNKEIRAYIMREKIVQTNKYRVLFSVGSETQSENIVEGESGITLCLAEKILRYNAPHKVGLYYLIEKEDTIKTNEIIEHLENLEKDESWWERLFQSNNWAVKKIHLQAMKLYNYKKYKEAKSKYESISDYDDYPEILLEIAQVNNQLGQVNNQFGEETIKAISICNKVISHTKGRYLEENEDKKLKKNALKSRASMILADIYSQNGKNYDLAKSDKTLKDALKELSEDDNKSNAGIYNWAANIKLNQLKNLRSHGNECEKIAQISKEAESYIKKVINLKGANGNFYDTYAEILLNKSDTIGFYKQIRTALKFPNIPKNITVNDYKKDKRWSSLMHISEFVAILDNAKKAR